MSSSAEIINLDFDKQYAFERAVEIYNSGGIFIYPTDTIYGIGCNPFNDSAMTRLNKLKGRDGRKHYILLINSINILVEYSGVPDKILEMLNKIWPAPVTAILNLNTESIRKLNQSTIAFRIPNHTFCQNLLEMINFPLVSTSVNFSNESPLVDIKSILSSSFVNKVDAIFYSPKEQQFLPSTLVDLTGKVPVVIREGIINFMELWQKLR